MQQAEEVQRYQDSRLAIQSLPHKNYERAQLLLFAGKRDHGKTFALKAYVERQEPRVFILDPFDDFGTVLCRPTIEEALADFTDGVPCRRRVVPPMELEPDEETDVELGSREYADKFFRLAIRHLRDCLIVLDEMTLWTKQKESAALQMLIFQGRRLGIRMAVACQRIQLIPGAVLSEATEMVLFRMSRPRDVDVVDEWGGASAAMAVQHLGVGECIVVCL